MDLLSRGRCNDEVDCHDRFINIAPVFVRADAKPRLILGLAIDRGLPAP